MKCLTIVLFCFCAIGARAQSADTPKYLLPPDTDTIVRGPTMNPSLQQIWSEQTLSGTSARIERAKAGFYTTSAGAAMYAFYNEAARGTILQVKNLSNGRTVYVKVLGNVPLTKAFAGCGLGLSTAAKAALGVQEQKILCEVSFAGY